MPGLIESYFSKTPYLPIRPDVRAKLRLVMESTAEAQEVRRMALEEAAYAYPLFAYNLLKLVNSEVFNLKTKIVAIKQAVLLPTFDKFGELIAASPDYPPELEAGFSLARFEEHGRASALAVQLLASLGRRFSTVDRERLYTAALLHDVGRVFLVMSDPAGYARVQREDPEAPSIVESERKYFGTDHATLGANALEAVGISDKGMLEGVRGHHEVPTGEAVLVAYADRIVKRFGIGPSDALSLSAGQTGQDDVRMKVAVEEALHHTIGDILMHVLSDIDGRIIAGMPNLKSLTGGRGPAVASGS